MFFGEVYAPPNTYEELSIMMSVGRKRDISMLNRSLEKT
jgi:hypothetical protein